MHSARAVIVLPALCAAALLIACWEKPLVLREAEVSLDFNRLPEGDRLAVPLFDGVVAQAIREEQEELPGGFTWAGRLESEPGSSVVLARKGDAVYGTVHTQAGKLYHFRPSPRGRLVQIIEELDPTSFPEGGADEPPRLPLPQTTPYQFCDDPNVIDVLVVYTEDARKGADTGNTGRPDPIEAAIYLAIAQGNSALRRSEIMHRMRLVHVEEVSYVESGDAMQDRDRLVDPSDGYLDDVPELRNDHGADVAVLIVETLYVYSGWSYINDGRYDFDDYAFSVVKRSVASTYNTFVHEVAHLMSARHDWEEDPTDDPLFTFNHGHFNTSPTTGVPPWRTIMSYNDSCKKVGGVDCIRIGYFSNPRLTYPPINGDPLGEDGDDQPTDNSQTLNEMAPEVEQFRCSIAPPEGEKVWMKDAWVDGGLEPDPHTTGMALWRSPYLWVRRTQDTAGSFEHLHQSPLANSRNWVYVKLHNSDTVPATGDLELWSTAISPSAHWPVDWDRVGSLSVSDFAPNSTKVVELPLDTGAAGALCLLARWVSPTDPMTFPEGRLVPANVRNNNNIIWKNVHVIDLTAISDALVTLRNQRGVPMTILVAPPERGRHASFLNHGAVDVQLEQTMLDAWRASGAPGVGFIDEAGRLRIGSNGARLENVTIDGDVEKQFHVRFHRLTSTRAGTYLLDVVQLEGNAIVGGVTFEVHVPEGEAHPDPNTRGVR